MRGLPLRLVLRLAFYGTCLVVALRLHATDFDRTEIVTILEMGGVGLAFEAAMALLPARWRGRMSLDEDRPLGGHTLRLVRLAIAGAFAVCTLIAVLTAVSAERDVRAVRLELGGLRDEVRELRASVDGVTGWLRSGDLTTGWTWRNTAWTARTPRDPEWNAERLVSEHMARVLETQRAQAKVDHETPR